MRGESKHFWSYVVSTCLLAISIVTSSLPWSYWAYTINTCPGYNCECVLYGKAFYDQFAGGETIYCKLITLLQVPLFLTASVLAFYQGRRALAVRRESKRVKEQKIEGDRSPILVLKSRTLISRTGRVLKEGDVFLEEKHVDLEPPSLRGAVALVVTSSVCLFLLATVYVLQVIGYHISCDEYRKMLMRLLKTSGNMAQIFSERLDCISIFGFMDYLQPIRNRYDPYDYERKYKINTGISLFSAQVSLLLNVFVWIYITYLNVRFLKKRKELDKKN